MTIQLSVTIWTIICFVLLMLILNFLLFKPVLKVMDERRARIEKAAQKKAENERLESEYASMVAEKEKEFLKEQKKLAKKEIEDIRLNTRKAIDVEKKERIQSVEAYRIRSKEEQEELLNMLSVHVEDLATTFANSLIKE